MAVTPGGVVSRIPQVPVTFPIFPLADCAGAAVYVMVS